MALKDDPDVLATLATLRERFRQAAAERPALEAACERAVVRTEWATDEYYSLKPLHHEIGGFSRGRLLATEPKKKSGKFSFGFDEADRLREVRLWGSDGPERVTHHVYDGDAAVLGWTYAGRRPASVTLLARDGDRPRRVVTAGTPPNWSASEYSYEGDRIAEVRAYSHGWPHEAVYTVEYDASGALRQIVYGGQPVYVAPERPLDELLAEVRDRLVESIPAFVGTLAVPQPAYCLALGFNKASLDELLPPQLALGLESNRRHYAAESALAPVWNPILFPDAPTPSAFPLDPPRDESVERAVREITARLAELGRLGPVETMLVQLAKVLNGVDWRGILPVTDDFVVYPVDYEDGVWEPYMEKSVPKARLTALRKRGLL